MTLNERWMSTRPCCKCGHNITEYEPILKNGKDLFCLKCSFNQSEGIICRIVNGIVRQIIDKKSLKSLPNGIYTLICYQGMLFIKDKFQNADSELIAKLNETSGHVLEKRTEGFMLRFSDFSHCHSDIFDLLSYEFDELDNIIDRKHEQNLKLICADKFVIGISVVPKSGVYKNNFISYEHRFTLADVNKQNPEQVTVDLNSINEKYSPADMLEYFEKRLIGQKKEIRKIVYLFCEYLQMAESGKNFKASNWMLTAPSGCGKTEVYRILRDYFQERKINIPVLQTDLSQYTESGFKGKEVEELIDMIAGAKDNCDGTAIVFLDEADKKFIPSFGTKGIDYNAAAQANLLTIIEGSRFDKSDNKNTNRIIDTGRTMFVFMGAFQSIRNNRQKKKNETNTIGFGTVCYKDNDSSERFYDDVSINDMIEFGMLEELAGRIEQVINLHRLSEKDMKYLIYEKAQLISEEKGITIEFEGDAVESFLDIAYTNLGIRNVTNCIKKLVCETVSSVYYEKDIDISNCTVLISSPDSAIIGTVENDMFCELAYDTLW